MKNKKLDQLSKKKIYNSDIFLLETNSKSDKLIVYFSEENVNFFSGVGFCKSIDHNKLFVKDSSHSWYNGTLGGVFKKDTDFFEELKSIVDCFDNKDVSFVGSKMGGYAAILYGVVLNIKKVLAFSPQFYIKSKYIEKLTDNIEKKIVYKNLYKVLDTVKFDTHITILTGSDQLINIYQLKEIDKYKKIKVDIVYTVDKDIVAYLQEYDLIEKLINLWLYEEKRYQKLPKLNLLNDPAGFNLIEKFINNHILDKLKEARDNLNELKHRYPFWITPNILDTKIEKRLGTSKNNIKKSYKDIISKDPNNLAANVELSQIYHQEKDFFNSALHSQKVLDISTNSRERYLIRSAIAYRNLHQFEKCLQALHQSYKINPNSFATMFQYGRVLTAKKLYIPALQSYKMALKIKPKHKQTMDEIRKIESNLYPKIKDVYSFGATGVLPLNKELNKKYDNLGIVSIYNGILPLYKQSDISLINFSLLGKYEYKDIKTSSLLLKEFNPNFLVIKKSDLKDETKKLLTQNIYDFNILGIDRSGGDIQASYIELNGKKVALISIDTTNENKPNIRSVSSKIKKAYDRVKGEATTILLHIQWNKLYIESSFKDIENILRRAVDDGYSAILSNVSDQKSIVEIYKNKTIIYDFGYMIADNKSVFFRLYLLENDTVGLEIVPLVINKNSVNLAKGNIAQKIKEQIKQKGSKVNIVEYADRIYFY
jgi:tetratricopeptide (TPR) repeat protein